MSEEKASRLGSTGQLIVRVLGAVGGPTATLWVAYVVYPEFRAWVWAWVDGVGPLVAGAAGIVIVGVGGVAVWKLWRQVVGAVRWLGGLGKRLYIWVLWQLVVRPARDRFGVEAAREGADQGAELAERLRRGGVRRLGDDSLALLGDALSRRDRASRWAVVHYPNGVPLDPVELGVDGAKARFQQACEELSAEGWITAYGEARGRRGGGFEVEVLLWTGQSYRLQSLATEVRLEVVSRDTREMLVRALSPGEEPVPPSGCQEKIRDLSGHGAQVLDYLLGLYGRRAGRLISEDLSDPEILYSPLTSLKRTELENALRELVESGFLEEPEWKGQELRVRVAECLARKSAARQVARWLEDLMVGQS